MMRPVLLALPPLKADTLAFDQAHTKTLTWNDNSITETSFVVQKSPTAPTWTTSGRSSRRSTSRTSTSAQRD